jgi:hypothetical protein
MSNTTDAATNWQEPPGISGGMPVTLQMLSTGVGELNNNWTIRAMLLHPQCSSSHHPSGQVMSHDTALGLKVMAC